MTIRKNIENPEMVDIVGLIPEDWEILAQEVIEQDKFDTCSLTRLGHIIWTEETETGDSEVWAQYYRHNQVLSIHQVTLEEYFIGTPGFKGTNYNESLLLAASVNPAEELEGIIESISTAYKEFSAQ
ncbi:MAG: hypothetical protein WDA47_03800 [Bacilli bacterium]